MRPGGAVEGESVGVIGTGQLGSVMADRLHHAGYRVLAYDVDPAALERLDPGVQRVGSAKEVASLAPVVITCVARPQDVVDCVLGEQGVRSGASAGTLVIDTTTSSPGTTRRVGAALGEVGAAMVDAPVSRGVPAARTGTLSAWLGGEEDDVARARAYLAPLATDMTHVGGLGAGHTVKAVNMMLMAVNLAATAEAVDVAQSYGVDPDALLRVLNASSGGNYMTSNHFPKFVQSGTYDSSFTAALMLKDVRVARDLAEELAVPTLFGSRVVEIYSLFLASVGNDPAVDNMRIVPFLRGLMSPSDVAGVA